MRFNKSEYRVRDSYTNNNMKNRFVIISVLLLLIFTACQSKIANEANPATMSNTPSPIETSQQSALDSELAKVTAMSGDEFIEEYVYGIEVATDLIFDTPKELSSDVLFDLFCYSLLRDNIDADSKWYDWDIDNYVIPAEDIESQLTRYFKEFDFDITALAPYDANRNALVTASLGWGGDASLKAVSKEVDGNTVMVVADIYKDAEQTELWGTKEYVFEFYDAGFYLLKCRAEIGLQHLEEILTFLEAGLGRTSFPEDFNDVYTNAVALYSYAQSQQQSDQWEWVNVPKTVDGEYNEFFRHFFGKDSSFPDISLSGATGIDTTEDSYNVGLGAFSGGNSIVTLEVRGNNAIVLEYSSDGPGVFCLGVDAKEKQYADIAEMLEDKDNLQQWNIIFEDTCNGFIIKDIIKAASAKLANDMDAPLTLTPTEFGPYYRDESDPALKDFPEDPNGAIYDINSFISACGWWCGAEKNMVISSSNKEPINEDIIDYKRDTFWLSDGNGIGEWINFKTIFAQNGAYDDLWSIPSEPGDAYTIPIIGIINGDATNDYSWEKYSRAKTIDVFLNDKLIYTLSLENTIQYQIFRLPFSIGFNYNVPFDLKFEIIDVYPGESDQVALSEIYLDPSIPH